MRASALAIVPGSALLTEYLTRVGYARWTGSALGLPEDLYLLSLAAIGLLAGPLLFAFSFKLLPLRSSPHQFAILRIAHLATWSIAAVATVFSILSV